MPIRSRRRQWTPEEDALMIEQSQGHYSMRQLEKAIHARRNSIDLRMEMLGVKPFIKYRLRPRASPTRARPQRSNKPPKVGDWEPGDEVNYDADANGARRELMQLHLYHGYRRYEELELKSILKRRN